MGKFDHIPELTGASAFHAWKSQVVLALGREGAYNHVSDGLDPTDFAEFASVLPTPADVAAPTAAERTSILEWLKEDAVAKDIICHRLFPAVQRLIPQEHSVTARDAWSLLHSHFNHVDLGSQHLIREKILSLQMADAADAEHYLGEHDALRRDLIRMGVAYSNSEAIFNLLKGLPRTGTWPAFKLVLQSSLSVASVASVASASSSLAKGKGKSVLSSSASSSSVSGGSSISGLLGSGTATFESISVHIAAEAHHLVLEASISPLVGSEFTNVAKTSRQTNVNPTTGLRCTKNNPSGVYCDTPLDNGSVCGAGSHDRAHCFKPGGGMAGQQPAHWKPFWRSKSGASDSSASANSAVGVPSGSAMQQPPLVAAAVVAPTPPSVPSSAWTTQEYDLSCTSIADLDDGDGCCPSDDVLACLSVQSYSSLLDTGMSHTLVRDHTHFHSYATDGSVHVKTANHGRLPMLGSGDCIALLPVGQDKFSVCFSGCLHVPSAMLNLLSIGSMVAKGWECNFRGAPPHCELVYHAQPLGSHLLQNNLCFLDVDFLHFNTPLPLLRSPVPLSAFARVSPTSDLWHARLGHVGSNAAMHVARFADGAVVDPSPLSICKSCIVGKHAHQPFHPSETQCSSGFLDLVHADVAGPMPVFTPHGKRYLLVILDDYTHVLDVHLLTTKDQALEAWEITRRHWENKYSRQVKTFRTDNGGEFVNSAFVAALNAAGISHQLSVPYMHQQNGKAEHVIRTVEGRVLAMLHFAGLSQTYWGEAALTAAYLHNRTESQALPSGKTPYEMLHGARPNISHLRIWGCRGFARIPLELQQKLGPKSREVLFMGYPPGVKGYRVRDKATGQFFNCRDVIFDENLALPHLFGDASVPAPDPCDDDDGDSDDDNGLPARSPALSPLLLSVPSSTVPSSPVMSSSSPPALRRSDRARTLTEAGHAFQDGIKRTKACLARQVPPSPLVVASDLQSSPLSPLSPLTPLPDSPDSNLPDCSGSDSLPFSEAVVNLVLVEHANLAVRSNIRHDPGSPGCDLSVPSATYEEAMWRPDADKWRAAMEKEMGLLHDMQVYDLVSLPPGAHAISSRWVLEYKSGDGKGGPVEKAHFVAKGFTQVPGHDFGRTFAPVARQASVRVITTYCAREDWELHSLDIKWAFLHGKIDEVVYIQQPHGYEASGPNGERLVGRLNSSLYGIKQAVHMFYQTLQEELESLGFVRCAVDHAVFTYRKGGVRCLTGWHVDDAMGGSNNESFLQEVKHKLHMWFGITDMGAIAKFLGIQFEWNRSTRELWIHQTEYIHHLLEEYGLSDCHPVHLPMDPNHPFLKDEDVAKLVPIDNLSTVYPKIIGELLYLSLCTHLDIAHAVQHLSQFISRPTSRLYAVAKRILHYLAGTLNHRLHYGDPTRTGDLHGFSDADWASCPEDRISVTGYCWFFHGGVVSHVSKKQTTQALSSTEVEYMAIAAAFQEGLWLHSFFELLDIPIPTPIRLYINNASAVALSKEASTNNRMKHIDIHFHFCRSHIESGTFSTEWLSSSKNTADILTKALPRPLFQRHASGLSLVSR